MKSVSRNLSKRQYLTNSGYTTYGMCLSHVHTHIKVFKELVEHHIKEEESKIFKSAEKTFEKNELEDIMKKFDQEKQRIKKS